MPTAIKIVINNITLHGELTETACAKQIIGKLPIETRPDEWGDEFYLTKINFLASISLSEPSIKQSSIREKS